MADPLVTTDTAIEVGKVAGSGGLGFFLAKMADRFMAKADKDAGKLDQILSAVQALSGRLDVMAERQTTTRADVDKLEAGVFQLQLQVADLAGQFKRLLEQIAR